MKIKTVLVSQPKPAEMEKSPYFDLVNKFGLKFEFRKFFAVEGIAAKDFRQDRIYINEFSGVIMTSRVAIDNFFRLMNETRQEVPDTMKYFCLSDQIAFYLQKYIQFRKRKIFYGNQTPESLIDLLKKYKAENLLFPGNDSPNEEIPSLMERNNISFVKSVIYQNVTVDLTDMNLKDFDMLAFFSPYGIKSLMHNFPEYKQDEQVIAVYGKTTHQAAAAAGLRVDIAAPTATAPSMVMAIEEFMNDQKKKK